MTKFKIARMYFAGGLKQNAIFGILYNNTHDVFNINFKIISHQSLPHPYLEQLKRIFRPHLAHPKLNTQK